MPRHVTRGFHRQRFRQLRIEKGWRAAELARAARVSPASIYSYENGARTPQVDVLQKVMTAMGASISAVVLIPPRERFPSYYRVIKGFTQPLLAAKAGLSTSQLRSIEAGEVNMSDSMAEKIAKALRMSPKEYRKAYVRCRNRPTDEPY